MHRAEALVGQLILKQSTLLSYIDTFWVMAVICFAAFPLAFLLRSIPLGKGSPH
jgi:hypothetical protein